MTLLLEMLDAHPELETYDQLFAVLDAERETFERQVFHDFVAEREEVEHGE